MWKENKDSKIPKKRRRGVCECEIGSEEKKRRRRKLKHS